MQTRLDDIWSQGDFNQFIIDEIMSRCPVDTKVRIKNDVVKIKFPDQKRFVKIYPVRL